MTDTMHAMIAIENLTFQYREGDFHLHIPRLEVDTGAKAALIGPSGSGKTTSVLACLTSSLGYLGDDTCAVETGRAPRVFGLYNTAKLTPDCVKRLPHLREAVSNPGRLDREKAVVFLGESQRARLERSCPVEAIVLPRVTARITPILGPASPSAVSA